MKQIAIKEPKCMLFVKKHKVAITTIVEIAGFVGTVYLACTEKTKAEKIIKENDIQEPKVKAKTYAYNMWPSVVMGMSTCGVIAYANVKSGNKIQELSHAAIMYKSLRENYEEAVKERVGEKKAEEIQHDASIKNAERSDLHVKGIIDTGMGHELFYDEVTDIWFYSSNQFVSRVAQDFSNDVGRKEAGYYSDFLEALGLPCRGPVISHMVFIRDSDNAYNIPSLKLEYGMCDDNRHELTGEKYAVLRWCGNRPEYVDNDVLYSIDI